MLILIVGEDVRVLTLAEQFIAAMPDHIKVPLHILIYFLIPHVFILKPLLPLLFYDIFFSAVPKNIFITIKTTIYL